MLRGLRFVRLEHASELDLSIALWGYLGVPYVERTAIVSNAPVGQLDGADSCRGSCKGQNGKGIADRGYYHH